MMTIPDLPPASLRLKIDRAALAENWRRLDQISGTAQAGAAIKADAYGVGVDIAVPTLLEAGARDFFVAHWGEVPAALQHVEPAMLSVLHGVTNSAEAEFARKTGVRPVINSLYQAKLWQEVGGGSCHLMIDSGMNRLGVAPSELGDPLLQGLDVDILMSHLASAEDDTPQNARQLAVFCGVRDLITHQRSSLANSAGIALGSAYHFDLTRPGLALYGGVPCMALEGRIARVVYPQAAILQLRDLKPGDAVGYNAIYTAAAPMRAATVSLGYADGVLRSWGANGALQHGGHILPIIGRVSMDMIVVDCTKANHLQEGDFLELPYDLPAASLTCGLSQYELLTTLGHRFDRK